VKKIAIFASGSGTNAENIVRYFKDIQDISVDVILTNNPEAKVIKRAEKLSVERVVFNKAEFYTQDTVLEILKTRNIDFIVLAGFLWLVPEKLIAGFPGKIINIHPALLPKYGGKGMYGMKVHESVIFNHEKESGITIHYVNNKYDEGNIIFQKTVKIDTGDTPDSLAHKIHELEYKYFPEVIEKTMRNQL
jgi:phosphoribosylglycinamide formyltransferase-1